MRSVALSTPALSDPLLATRVQQGCPFVATWNVLSEKWEDDEVQLLLVGNETKTAGNFFVAGHTRAKDSALVSEKVDSSLAPGFYRVVLRDTERAAKAHTEVWDPLAGQTYEYVSEQVFLYAAGAFDDCPPTRPTSAPTSAGAASAHAATIAAVEWGAGTLVVALLAVGIVGGGAAAVVVARRRKRDSELAQAPPLLPGGVVKSTSPAGNGNRNRIVSSYDSQRMW
jgi:hypothetical protein